MNQITKYLSKFRTPKTRGKTTGPVVIAHWDRETIDFLVVNPKSKQLTALEVGSVPRADHANPFKALAEYFTLHAIKASRLVALLSRPELDQLTLDLPPAEANELPSLVASAVEQQLGDTDDPPRVDYCPVATFPRPLDESTGSQVLAFALAAAEFKSLQAQCESAGFRLAAIGSRQLSPLGALRQRSLVADSLTIAVSLYAGEAELAICRGADPILLRSLRINPEEPVRVVEQIWMETQRCLTLLPQTVGEMSLAWYVFTNGALAWQVVRGLEERGLDVIPIDPLVGWEVLGRAGHLHKAGTFNKELSDEAEAEHELVGDEPPTADTAATTELAGASAAVTGAAYEFLNTALPVNLLAPKQAPTAPNPLVRWGAMAAAALVVLAIGLNLLLSDLGKLGDEVTAAENELAEAKKLSAKFQGKADQVQYVESWLADQVDWLDELNALSKRLPDGEAATVRRLTASTADRTAVFDLSVQVAAQDNVSQLENSIRSEKYFATSKRISQNAESVEYPWQFETRISFGVESPLKNKYASKSTVTAPTQDIATHTGSETATSEEQAGAPELPSVPIPPVTIQTAVTQPAPEPKGPS